MALFSLGSLRYCNVLAQHGGPIARIEVGQVSMRGRTVTQANARLKEGLVTHPRNLEFYSNDDGTGTHAVPSVARHMAVSEALERWAFHTTVHSDRAAEFGFDVDPTSNGMSAFPSLFSRSARRKAVLEAVERFSLVAWWEGRAHARSVSTDWPGVSALAIEGPMGGITVIAYARTNWGYAYGHAAEESFGAACERAMIELSRHESILRSRWLSTVSGQSAKMTNLMEQRSFFFATEEGHELFQQRAAAPCRSTLPKPEVVCDAEIDGPWSDYATVWRFGLRPLTLNFLTEPRFFFW